MSNLPQCPRCRSTFTYLQDAFFVCPECGHEWNQSEEDPIGEKVWKDAHGTLLREGDSVTVIKDLKVKGSSSVIKVGTKVKNIRLIEGDHDIDCRIEGVGAMQLKSAFVKKA